MFSTVDTIVAIATPAGRGGLGVVRVSGPAARDIAGALLSRTTALRPRHATFARVRGLLASNGDRESATARPIDQVVATFFPAPASYTGEDILELSAHGSPVVLRAIVDSATRAGARLAEPGEFTLRAFLNGRLDLVQAEAVGDLIDAVTPRQARAAFDQLEGTLTGEIGAIDATLFDLIAKLEASLDFPDEGYHFVGAGEVAVEVAAIARRVDELLQRGRAGRIVREGAQVVILGKPNVGKSSLFNFLVGAGRAIVTEEPGTTRDLLTEVVDIEGLKVTLVDTAGLRATAERVEAEGVARARQAASVADLQIVVLDRSRPLEAEDRALLEPGGAGRADRAKLFVINKIDECNAWEREEGRMPIDPGRSFEVSLRTGEGARGLPKGIAAALGDAGVTRDVVAVTNQRHIGLLERAGASLRHACTELEAADGRLSEEFVLQDLHHARAALEEVRGRRAPDELLQHIFSRFCIGK
jgi:tRNA modification GTPase